MINAIQTVYKLYPLLKILKIYIFYRRSKAWKRLNWWKSHLRILGRGCELTTFFARRPLETFFVSNFAKSVFLLLATVSDSYIGGLADLPRLKSLSLSWIGLFGSFKWKYDFIQFLIRQKSAQRELKNLKLCQAALVISDAMVEVFPTKLNRLLISNMNRSDPSYINAKCVDYGSPG